MNWDTKQKKMRKLTRREAMFLEQLDFVCQKHGISISHEDGHGAFILTDYDDSNRKWLESATLDLSEEG